MLGFFERDTRIVALAQAPAQLTHVAAGTVRVGIQRNAATILGHGITSRSVQSQLIALGSLRTELKALRDESCP